MNAPKLPPVGLCLPCRFVRAVDGDTVEITALTGAKWKIRLIDCWAPERHSKAGKAATEFCTRLCEQAARLFVWIPAPESVYRIVEEGGGASLLKATTFDRLPGWLFTHAGDAINRMMVLAGHATAEKPTRR